MSLSSTAPSSVIGFAVVGCGHIGKRHAEMVRRHSSARLVALVDTVDKADLGLDAYRDVPFFASLELFLASREAADTDVVCIATPNGYHADQALQCLDARKHVVIEKPLALRKSDAEAVIFKALHVHKHVFAVMQNRYSPPSVWIKDLIESGRMGKVYMVQFNCYWNRDSRYYKPGGWHGTAALDGGTLFTQFSHFIDTLYWLFGDIQDIRVRMVDHNHERLTEFNDSGFVNFELVNGGIGCINFSTSVWDTNLESSMTIIAEKGSVKIGGQYMDKVEYCHIQDYQMPELTPAPSSNDYGFYKGSTANHHFVIENIVDVLNGRGKINTNALEGLKVVDIIERIYNVAGQKDPN